MTRPKAVRVWLLGSFRISVGSGTVQDDVWRLKKAANLVKLLALAPGHRLHREQVMDLLWPDSGRRAASNNLRQTLYAARRALDPAAGSRYLVSEDEVLVLCPKSDLWVDVEAFEEAAKAARHSREPAAYRAAVELYTGELLPEDRYEEWAETRRQELRRMFLSLLVELARSYEERGGLETAIDTLRSAVAEELTFEEAHVGLMRLYALSDRREEALTQYERFREVLSERLATEPGVATRRLRDEIATGKFPGTLTVAPPSEEVPHAGKHNLPAARDSFVGREREMVEIKRAMSMTRLLTLTGTGGSGKTRLAVEAARDLVGAYPDGIWLSELAGLSEGSLVPQTVATAVGIVEQPGRLLTDTLSKTLRGKKLLLVLDNCEHLIEAAARLLDTLLDSCPRLRVLATSRESLGIVGETNWPVRTLSVPDRRRSPTVAELEGYESARLFLERARHRDPSFALTPQNAQAVAEICRTLDGIPLAIELAAARVRALSVEQIAARLEDSLGLLTGGSRMVAAKQQTLRGALDWSYDLLGEPEQALFGRLSVFAGGWTLEAAEAVGTGHGVREVDVLDLLARLVDKSLVAAGTGSEGAVRYRMLEPVRQYARERLEAGKEADAVQRRHAEFFVALAEEAESSYRGPEEATWLDRLEAEHDNMRAALSWSLAGGDHGLGLRLAAALWWFWNTRGYFGEGARWLEEALARGSAAPPTDQAGVLYSLGRILEEQGDLERAEACQEEALRLYEELGDRQGVADSLTNLGWVTFGRNDYVQAEAFFEEGLATARKSGNRRLVPGILHSLACVAREDGDFERAQRLWGEALALVRAQGSNVGAANLHLSMGTMELALGNWDRAKALLEEGLVLSREVGDKTSEAGCLRSLGIAATLQGDPQRAKTLIKESLRISLELGSWGSKQDIFEGLEGLAEAAGALGEEVRVARLWGAAGALRETLDFPWLAEERMLHEPELAAARSRMDEVAWEAAFAEGQAMSFEEAVEYALSEEEAPTSASLTPDQPSVGTQPASLTRRQQEVALLVARGLTNRQIAAQLVISEHTAATHVAGILKKLGLNSRSQLSAWIAEKGLSSSGSG